MYITCASDLGLTDNRVKVNLLRFDLRPSWLPEIKSCAIQYSKVVARKKCPGGGGGGGGL